MADSERTQDSLLDMFIFECNQLNEQLVELLLDSEKNRSLTSDDINEIFRIMHTIKGSAALMNYADMSKAAHGVEDLFYFIRENKPEQLNYETICDIVLSASDFIKAEIDTISSGAEPDGDCKEILKKINQYLDLLKNGTVKQDVQKITVSGTAKVKDTAGQAFEYELKVTFEPGWQMENVRAFTAAEKLREYCHELTYSPENLLEDHSTAETIVANGFYIKLTGDLTQEEIRGILGEVPSVLNVDFLYCGEKRLAAQEKTSETKQDDQTDTLKKQGAQKSSMISVNTAKLDILMDLVGEIVISEAMVLRNPDLKGLKLESFYKAASQLKKLTNELQDAVMSIRMISIAGVFSKMNRIVRDMNKKLNKDVELEIIGQETEVDKNIIDHLSDPIMHLVRNALDHGIEDASTRAAKGKPEKGKIVLEAYNTGSEVVIQVKDDGKGLNRKKLLEKARGNGLISKREADLTDRDILNLALVPGISTKENVTEYSGRGVGLDVVKKNIDEIGGNILLESTVDVGTTVTMRIPLTLAIVEGMEIAVGNAVFSIPISSISETLRPGPGDVFIYPEGHEMIMIREQCIPVVKLYDMFDIPTQVTDFTKGILVVAEYDHRSICLFADEILGEQQVVVKNIPSFLSRYDINKNCGIGGCTILGDGSISLILDISKLVKNVCRN